MRPWSSPKERAQTQPRLQQPDLVIANQFEGRNVNRFISNTRCNTSAKNDV